VADHSLGNVALTDGNRGNALRSLARINVSFKAGSYFAFSFNVDLLGADPEFASIPGLRIRIIIMQIRIHVDSDQAFP
jgi:hypothetical protein